MKRLALFAILLVAGAQALSIQEIQAEDGLHAGIGHFLWLAEEDHVNEWNLSISAAAVVIEETTSSYISLLPAQDAGILIVPSVPVYTNQPETSVRYLGNAVGSLGAHQSGAVMAIFSQPTATDLELDQHSVHWLESPTFDRSEGLTSATIPSSEGGAISNREWGTSLMVAEATSGDVQFSAYGDFVMEGEFFDVNFDTASGRVAARGTHDVDGQATVESVTQRSIRITLIDAEISLSIGHFQGLLQAATEQVSISSTKPLSLINATGILEGNQLEQEDVAFAKGHIDLHASSSGMAASIPKSESSWAAVLVAPSISWLWSLLLVLPLGLLFRKQATHTSMEAAIEDGSFQRASNIASRILKKNPLDEKATMGWAVAKSKLGQQAVVIRRLQYWLDKESPKDGVFHYVMGLAHMDLGNKQAANACFDEAVKLSPSLQSEIPRGPVVAEHAYV